MPNQKKSDRYSFIFQMNVVISDVSVDLVLYEEKYQTSRINEKARNVDKLRKVIKFKLCLEWKSEG